ALHLAEIGPLLHRPAVGKNADAVLAARAVAELALAAALHTEHRGRIGQREGVVWSNSQQSEGCNEDRWSHIVVLRFAPQPRDALRGFELSVHCRNACWHPSLRALSVADELSGLGSTRVVRFSASGWRRIDEPGDVATGPANAEVSRRFEPLGTA